MVQISPSWVAGVFNDFLRGTEIMQNHLSTSILHLYAMNNSKALFTAWKIQPIRDSSGECRLLYTEIPENYAIAAVLSVTIATQQLKKSFIVSH